MTTGQLLILDDLVALLTVAAWFACGVGLALGRARPGLVLLVVAVLATAARAGSVAVLAGRGWWFVQEKVVLGLPLLGIAALVAVLLAGPPLLVARAAQQARVPARAVVAVLTAAYAALAGPAVTLAVGYPLTWGPALVTVALVLVAALLTARAVASPSEPDPAAEPQGVTRRALLGLAGGAAVAAGGAGAWLSSRPAGPVTSGGGPGRGHDPGVSVTDLRGATSPAPGGVRRTHLLTAQQSRLRLASGREIDAWSYDRRVPGPPITATEGDLLEVTLRNADIEDGVTLHWHGYDVACGEDGAPGVTQPVVMPGQEFAYHFPADQVGTYWYHTHQASHEGVRRGLYGTLVVTPRDAGREGLDLTLPVHTFDDTVVLGDSDDRTDHAAAVGAPVRLRLVNTDSEPHRFALAGSPFRVAAVDGRDLNRPDEVSEVGLRLPAGGRYDVVFDMPDAAVALLVDDDPDGGLVLRPDGAGDEPPGDDTAGWPELDLLGYGAPAAVPFDPDAPDRHFTLVLDRGVAMVDGRPAYAQTVNGLGHPSIPDQLVTEGDLVRFTVVNRSLETHPWHLHGHPVLVLSRDGTPSSGSPLWVDTFDVRPGEVWEVAFRAANRGIWMNHCHNLPHAEQGMMLRLRYDGVTTPFGEAHHGH